MCGHFGFVVTKTFSEPPSPHAEEWKHALAISRDESLDVPTGRGISREIFYYFVPSIVRQIFNLACQRGPDGHGWWDMKTLHRYAGKNRVIDDYALPVDSLMCIGHARLHTVQGTAFDVNCLHPLRYGQIVMAHNGFIRNYQLVNQMLNSKETDAFRVDSEALAYLLNRYHDFENAIASCETDGYYAVVYYDEMLKELHIVVKNMPFYVRNDNGTYYWCSKEFPGSEKFEGHLKLTPYCA